MCNVINNKKHKIIFLDIDGVLNGYNKWNLLGWNIVKKIKYKPLELWYVRITSPFGVHESKVKRLAKIVKATNAKIVMSSSWRHGWWKCPYKDQYEDQKRLTDLFNKYNIEVIDITPTAMDGRRDKEITTWLARNENDVFSYIILDDEDADMLAFKNDNRFIQTIDNNNKTYTGLKYEHVDKAIKMLNISI